MQMRSSQNPEQRCPCALLLDTSGSMQGQAINQLNDALQFFKEYLHADALAAKRVELAVVTVNVRAGFTTVDASIPRCLSNRRPPWEKRLTAA